MGCDGGGFTFPAVESRVVGAIQEAASAVKFFGGEMNWSELMTPGVGTVPASEKDFILESSFHIRTSPSHEPGANKRLGQ